MRVKATPLQRQFLNEILINMQKFDPKLLSFGMRSGKTVMLKILERKMKDGDLSIIEEEDEFLI